MYSQYTWCCLSDAGNRFAIDCDPRKGLACINSQQPGGKRCADYRVRFLCPAGTIQNTRGIVCRNYCETPFYDRDNPSGHCDCEQRSLGPYSGPIPVGIRCIERKTGKDYQDIGQRMTCTPLVSTPVKEDSVMATVIYMIMTVPTHTQQTKPFTCTHAYTHDCLAPTHPHTQMRAYTHLQIGGVCWNARNPGNMCKDYLVQYIYPCKGCNIG